MILDKNLDKANEEELLNIRISIIAAQVLSYSMICINGRHEFKNRLSVIKNSVKSLESYFSHDPSLKKEFIRDEYVLFYALIKETADFESKILEEIIDSIKSNVEKPQ